MNKLCLYKGKKNRFHKVAIASVLIFLALVFVQKDYILDVAVQNKSLFLTKLMLSQGADPNYFDEGEPLLYYAAENHDPAIVQTLVARGATVDQRGQLDLTPLMYAIENNDFETAAYLVSRGASLTYKNRNGQTAASLALKSKDIRIRRLVKS